MHVWFPDPSVPSLKRVDPSDQQGISNCQRERRKEKFLICTRYKGKAIFFLEDSIFLAFTTQGFSICQPQVKSQVHVKCREVLALRLRHSV